MGYQTGLADELRRWGLVVEEYGGWHGRGSSSFTPQGGVAHHTANSGYRGVDAPSLEVCVHGRPDLSGPLAQVVLGYSGCCYVIAAGRANHAGNGGWHGLSGNSSVWGIEAENNGVGEPWPAVQLEAYTTCAAAMAAYSGFGESMWCAHREWSTEGKPDPTGIDMPWFRGEVARKLREGPQPAPDEEEDMAASLLGADGNTGAWWEFYGVWKRWVQSPEELNNLTGMGTPVWPGSVIPTWLINARVLTGDDPADAGATAYMPGPDVELEAPTDGPTVDTL